MSNNNEAWIIQIGEVYLKHPAGPQTTKNPSEAHGCHYKSAALDYLEEFAYLAQEPYNKNGKLTLAVTRRKDAKEL